MNPVLKARLNGEPISHILRELQERRPMIDDLLNLNYIIRICFKEGQPFTEEEIIRTFDSLYSIQYHGSRQSCLKWINKYLCPSDKSTFLHIDSKKLGDSRNDFSEDKEMYSLQLNLSHSEGGRNE